MSDTSIYHNPRCSKSRQTLALLQDNGVEPQVILYLDTPPKPKQLADILQKLNISARELLRKGEAAYKELNLADAALTETQIIKAMCAQPKLIERPIVIKGQRAVLGRPPENVLELV